MFLLPGIIDTCRLTVSLMGKEKLDQRGINISKVPFPILSINEAIKSSYKMVLLVCDWRLRCKLSVMILVSYVYRCK